VVLSNDALVTGCSAVGSAFDNVPVSVNALVLFEALAVTTKLLPLDFTVHVTVIPSVPVGTVASPVPRITQGMDGNAHGSVESEPDWSAAATKPCGGKGEGPQLVEKRTTPPVAHTSAHTRFIDRTHCVALIFEQIISLG
jgi:hypothetical protein